MKKRLFTFGCSHTQYVWPSWADILGLNFEQFYNFGQPGSGIFYTLYQFVFGNQHFKFGTNDTLIFMLSNEDRLDIVKQGQWLSEGHTLHNRHIFGEKFFEHYSEVHAIESAYIYVYFLKNMLDTLDCNYKILYAFPPPFDEAPHKFQPSKSLKEIWKKTYKLTDTNIISLTEFSKIINDVPYNFIKDDGSGEIYKDGHYTISTHLQFVKKYLSEYYDERWDDTVNGWHNSVQLDSKTNISEKFSFIKKNEFQFVNGIIING